jgi:hypothetical protein
MIDTGANRTFVSIKALDSIRNRNITNKTQRRVLLADGRTSISVYSEMSLSIIVNNVYTSIRALIVKDLCADCILGMDFIAKYKHINIADQTVSFGVRNHRLIIPIVSEEGVCVRIRLINSVRILPRQQLSVVVSLPVFTSHSGQFSYSRRTCKFHKIIQELLQANLIRPLYSPYAALALLVTKKDST